MTLGEIIRAIESKKRQQKAAAQEKATFDYIQADLIGRSISRLHSSSNRMPQLAEIYPSLFEAAEIESKIQEKKQQLSIIRFKQFAQSHNNKYKEVEKGE